MPKVKQSLSNKLRQYVAEYPADFKTDSKILFCKLCNKAVSAEKTFRVKQHLQSAAHKQLKERDVAKATQQFIGESSSHTKDH